MHQSIKEFSALIYFSVYLHKSFDFVINIPLEWIKNRIKFIEFHSGKTCWKGLKFSHLPYNTRIWWQTLKRKSVTMARVHHRLVWSTPEFCDDMILWFGQPVWYVKKFWLLRELPSHTSPSHTKQKKQCYEVNKFWTS